jgi:hypothetical protein
MRAPYRKSDDDRLHASAADAPSLEQPYDARSK